MAATDTELTPAEGGLEEEPSGARVLVVFAYEHLRTRRIAEAIRERITASGWIAELADTASAGMPPPADYDAVIVGLTLERVRERATARWIAEAREALRDTPSALFAVGSTRRCARRMNRVLQTLGCRPLVVDSFANASRWWSRSPADEPIDPGRVARFTDQFLSAVEARRLGGVSSTQQVFP